jgi:tetratricopeptide (TPR) repeat protein
LRKAELIAKNIVDSNIDAEIIYRYAVSNYVWRKYDIAYQKYIKALKIFKEHINLKGIAKCNTGIGLFYVGIGRYTNAIAKFNK